jgi:hypothetical protein
VLLQIIVADMIEDDSPSGYGSAMSQGAGLVVQQARIVEGCTMRERLLEIPAPNKKEMLSDTPHSWNTSTGETFALCLCQLSHGFQLEN